LPTGDHERDSKLAGLGGVFNSLNLALFTYGHENPVKYYDLDGNEIKISGSKQDVREFISQVYKATGLRLQDQKGTLVQTGSRNTKIGSESAAKVFTDALKSKDVITVKAVRDDPNVLVDSFATNKVDVADTGSFFKKSNLLGAEALVHIIDERAYAAEHGGDFGPAHAHALAAGAKEVKGAATRTATMSPAYEPGAHLDINFYDAKGKVVDTFSFTLDKNLTPQ